jgi:MFS transporter, DHA1 family, multidrug resistance protein
MKPATPAPPNETHPIHTGIPGGELMALMALVMAIGSLGTDMMLPAFPAMVQDLSITPFNHVQYVIMIYVVGQGIGSLFFGALADRYGRRRVLIWAIATYALMTLICRFSADFEILLALRFITGFASAALGVVAISIIRDQYSGDAMAQRLSMIFLIFMIVPIIAPSLGQLVLKFADWRGIFTAISAISIACLLWVSSRLQETLKPENVIPITLSELRRTSAAVVSHRSSVGYLLASGLIQGTVFGFLTSSQQIIDQVFHKPENFGLYFGIVSIGIASSNLGNSWIVMKFGARRVLQSALLLFILAAAGQFLASIYAPNNLSLFLGLLTANLGMLGFIGSNSGSIAMQPFGAMAGAASSFQTFARMMVASAVGGTIGQSFNGTASPFALGFLLSGIGAFAAVYWAESGKLFTRPGTTKIGPF